MKTLRHIALLTVTCTMAVFTLHAQPNQPGSGNCLKFDGVNDWVDFIYDPIFTPDTQGRTVSAWIKCPLPSSGIVVESWYRCGANPACDVSDGARYHLMIKPDGKAVFVVRDDNNNNNIAQTSSVVADNNWHHIAGTFDPATETTKIYVDGVLSGSITNNITSLSDGGNNIPLQIGRLFVTGWGAPQQYYNGQMDEVRIWNYARSQTQIREDMCKKLTGTEPGLVGYWRLDEGSGNTAFDSSPNGNDGTLY